MARTRSRFDDDVAPKSDVYTGLLALSLIAMIVSCLLLFLDYSQYGNTKAPNVAVPQPKGREGVVTGQLPPPLLTLPPPAPVGERPFTRGAAAATGLPPGGPTGGRQPGSGGSPAGKRRRPRSWCPPRCRSRLRRSRCRSRRSPKRRPRLLRPRPRLRRKCRRPPRPSPSH